MDNSGAQAGAPGRGWYVVAAALGVAGIVVAVGLLVRLVFSFDETQRFLGPGRHAVELRSAGKHLVWSDYNTVFEGQVYGGFESLPPGARVQVLEARSGRRIDVGATYAATSNVGSTKRRAIAAFEAKAPGSYEIVIEGNFPPQVFSVSPDILPVLLLAVVGAIGAALLGLAAGTALAVWVYLRRHPAVPAARTEAAGGASATPAVTPGQSSKQFVTAVYALQAASFVVGITLIAGVIVDYVKRDAAAGTWLESHFTWQIRTFWWWLAWFALGLVLLIVLVGIFILIADGIWLLYRIIKGWVRLSEGKPMYA